MIYLCYCASCGKSRMNANDDRSAWTCQDLLWIYYAPRPDVTCSSIYSTFTLSWSLIRNPVLKVCSLMYGIFCLTNFSRVQDSKRIYTPSRLKQVPWRLDVRQPGYSLLSLINSTWTYYRNDFEFKIEFKPKRNNTKNTTEHAVDL